MSHELRQKHLNLKKKKKTFIVLVTQSVTGKRGNVCSIIAKAVNKQNTPKLLRYKL